MLLCQWVNINATPTYGTLKTFDGCLEKTQPRSMKHPNPAREYNRSRSPSVSETKKITDPVSPANSTHQRPNLFLCLYFKQVNKQRKWRIGDFPFLHLVVELRTIWIFVRRRATTRLRTRNWRTDISILRCTRLRGVLIGCYAHVNTVVQCGSCAHATLSSPWLVAIDWFNAYFFHAYVGVLTNDAISCSTLLFMQCSRYFV